MPIEEGVKYQISQAIQRNFNSAEVLSVVRNDGRTVQFTLGEGKGYGSMPVEHLNYLLRKENLTQIPGQRGLFNRENSEKQIG